MHETHKVDKTDKLTKKDKKKQKIKSKIQEGVLKSKNQPQPTQPNIIVRYDPIPKIVTQSTTPQQQQHKQQSKDKDKDKGMMRVMVRNKRITDLYHGVISHITSSSGSGSGREKMRKVQIIGAKKQIPKSVSLAQMLKRRLDQLGCAYEQFNVIGKNQESQPCVKITLELG